MGSDPNRGNFKGWSRPRGLLLKSLVLMGGAYLLRKFMKSATSWDRHARVVMESLVGEKYSRGQASRDPDAYFNLRIMTCPAADTLVGGSRILYTEHAFWRNPQKPFRQRFLTVKPCSKEMKCDVEVTSHAINDAEEYKNFCDRLKKDQRPQPEEVIKDMGENLTTIHLKQCDRGRRCMYEGSTELPNSWNGASYSTWELSLMRNGEVHTWDRGYDDDGNQVWGATKGPYEFKATPPCSAGSSLEGQAGGASYF